MSSQDDSIMEVERKFSFKMCKIKLSIKKEPHYEEVFITIFIS